MVSRYLTTREVAERTGLPLESIRAMMDPRHPEFIPNVNVRTKPTKMHPRGRPRYRIAEEDLKVWLDAHRTEYDPAEDADSELVANPPEEPPGSEDDYEARAWRQREAAQEPDLPPDIPAPEEESWR